MLAANCGDVVLFGGMVANDAAPVGVSSAGLDPISEIIRQVTKSPFSHTAICVTPSTFANSVVGLESSKASADVQVLNLEAMKRVGAVRELHLLRPAGQIDGAKLSAYVAEAERRAGSRGDDRMIFSVGALAGLAVLRLAVRFRAVPVVDEIRRALIVALDDGDRRLFCSEFVYRASAAAGFVPPLPEEPFLPGDLLDGIGALDSRDLLVSTFERVKGRLQGLVPLDEEAKRTFGEVLHATVRALEDRTPVPPDREEANFYVPADFAACVVGEGPPYAHVATWDAAAQNWGVVRSW
jgi:hypothetical protein